MPGIKRWAWTAPRERAAFMVAEDAVNDVDIAAACGISRRQLLWWKSMPQFIERVAEHRQAVRDSIRKQGIAIVENRVKRLQSDWLKLQQIAKERGESEEFAGVPGGQTGLLVKQIKGIGKGDDFQVVEAFAVDTGLLAELRAHEMQAAKELQQWMDKVEHSTDLDQLDAAIERELALMAAGTEKGAADPAAGEKPA